MVMMGKEDSKNLEWRINVEGDMSQKLEPKSGVVEKFWSGLKGLVRGFVSKIWNFLEKARGIGVSEPKKVIHGLKVGLALSLVSLFYYMRPLYDGVGGSNAMWAVMTVVVVFEYTIGATFCKCINRATATFLAGSLGIGVHWVANQSGEEFKPIILGTSVFILASLTTFSRFVPSVKARFDYGAVIFILTFSLVSVSGYRVEKLFELAHQRLSTIAIGTSLCIVISMLICPIWAGDELHHLINNNMEKLADSLDGCVAEFFKEKATMKDNEENINEKLEGYKSVLNAKATEESLANFARWEPAHGRFHFRHPWKQYLKIGASMRNCAYCIENLFGCINSEIQAPEYLKKNLSNACMTLSSHSSNVLKELSRSIKTMKKSSKIDFSVGEMNFSVQELRQALKSLPNHFIPPPLPETEASDNEKEDPIEKINAAPPLMEVLPLATLVSLLIEIAARIENMVDEVDELAKLAEFKVETDKKKRNQLSSKLNPENHDHETMKSLPKV